MSKIEAEILIDAIDCDRHECGGMLLDRTPHSVAFWRQGSYNNPRATRQDLEQTVHVNFVLECSRCHRMYRSTARRVETHEENGPSRVLGYLRDGVLVERPKII